MSFVIPIRFFVPAGGRIETAKFQWFAGKLKGWKDVPVIYEDPGDEIVECPALCQGDGLADHVCALCFGDGRARQRDIDARLKYMQEMAK